MSTDFIDYLSDAELHNKCLECGFPNTPVTETTRQLLIKKLKMHTKKEKTKRRISKQLPHSPKEIYENGSYHLRRNSNNPINSGYGPATNYDNNNALNINNKKSFYSNTSLDKSISSSIVGSSSRMYAPPPVLASESESDCEQNTYTPSYPRMCGMSTPVDSSKYVNSNSVYNNSDGGVVSRLLSLRDSTIQRKYRNRSGIESNDHKIIQLKRYNLKTLKLGNFILYIKSKLDYTQIIIPYVLIGALLLFFLVISIVYLSKRSDKYVFDESTVNYKACDGSYSQEGSCIDTHILKDVLTINKELIKVIEERTRKHYCGDGQFAPRVIGNEVENILSTYLTNDNVVRMLNAAKYLISENPQWNIKIRDMSGLEAKHHLPLNELSFELLKPNLPLKCILYNKMQRFFIIMGSLSVIGGVVGLIYAIIKFIAIRKRERILTTHQVVKDVINELVAQTSEAGNGKCSEIILDNLRDKLIPPNKRKQLMHSWNDALNILEKDGRILFGVIMRNGVEQRTISWNGLSNEADNDKRKKWHSPAFDKSNRIANPPTPCLKIRHMFDASEINNPNLKQLIIDAIIEKVGTRCKICDVQLDRQTYCVYLRCASEKDAGIVHNEINGWWFDKRLISIKFLRLERYLNRFPKSLSEPICFDSNLANVNK